MMLSMTETDYENWRDDLRCGGREEYDAQYSAASLYEGGWRSDAISDLRLEAVRGGGPQLCKQVSGFWILR